MRALKILVVAGVVAVAGLGTSAPAMAAANPSVVSVTCTDPGFCSATVFSASAMMANPGDTFTVHNGTSFAGLFQIQKDGVGVSGTVTVASDNAASMTAPSALGSYTIQFTGGSDPAMSLTVTNDPITPAPLPVPIIGLQQVGVPASGDCADVPVTVGHDQGFPIGGWSKSWSQWINNGTGGTVCTRTVEQIDNADGTSRLVVNP